MSTNDLMSPAQISAMAGISRATVQRHIREGVLPGRRTPGGHMRVTRADAEHYARAYTVGTAITGTEPTLAQLTATLVKLADGATVGGDGWNETDAAALDFARAQQAA